jgi:acyl-CoA synthetase (AMP-forming)/AMP-acid ligase II
MEARTFGVTINPRGAQLNIASGIIEFSRATPHAVAVVDGERSLTYAELETRSRQLANALTAAGLQQGDRVAVVLGNRLEYPEIACAIGRAGMQMVPVNPRLTPPEVEYILQHSNTRALVLDNSLAPICAEALQTVPHATVLSIDGTELGIDYENTLAAASLDPCDVTVSEDEPFCIAYTSGTTGRPKGVMISHRSRSLTFLGTAITWGLGPGRTTIAVAPLYHGAGFAFGYGALHVGGTLWMLRAFDPKALLQMLQDSRAESVFLVPTHGQMLRALGDDVIAQYDLSKLKTLYFNAAPMPHPLKMWLHEQLPDVELHELYGSTEAGIVTNCGPADVLRKPGSVGLPWFMTELRIVSDEGEIIQGAGVGELFSRSPYLMNGYLDDEEATQACTTPDGFLTAGDVVRVDDEGFIHIIDRKKDMIISGGVNVYPREVEDVLVTHPKVREVAVVGMPDEKWGEAVTAFIVAAPQATPSVQELEELCRSSLAGFKVPRRYEFVGSLPRNAAGKVLKRELRGT